MDARLRGHDVGCVMLPSLLLPAVGPRPHRRSSTPSRSPSGFTHPFTGLDHMLAMVAVGLWAGLNGGRALWAWPAAFVGVMVLGGALGIAGVAVPMVEPGILASVVVLGLLVLAAAQLPVAAGAVLVAAFALLHGHAHGAELPARPPRRPMPPASPSPPPSCTPSASASPMSAGSANGRLAVRGAGALVAAAGVALALDREEASA